MRASSTRRQLEAAILAAALNYPAAIDEAGRSVELNDLCDPAHRALFLTLQEMRSGGAEVGLETVVDQLQKAGRLGEAGGAAYVGELWDKFTSTAALPEWCKRVKEYALLDRLYSVGCEIAQSAKERRGRAADVIAEAESRVFELSKAQAVKDVRHVNPIVQEVLDRIDKRSRGECMGLATSFAAIDQLTAGLHGGELVVVAARPGVGKSSLAINLAGELASVGGCVLFVSLEMGEHEIVERLIVKECRIPAQDVRTGTLTTQGAAKVLAAARKVERWPLYVDDRSEQTTSRIASTARRMDSMGLKLVVIDYLQLVSPENRRAARQEQVAGVSRDLKRMARQLMVPVVALAQLNREVEGRNDKKPRLSDLRESGGIEADADVVLLLHQAAQGQLDVIVAKQRNGPLGEVTLKYEPHLHTIEDL